MDGYAVPWRERFWLMKRSEICTHYYLFVLIRVCKKTLYKSIMMSISAFRSFSIYVPLTEGNV